ncbi:MAG TPA: thrombospondin type 3 repeat-containing protein, partial [Chthoniobacterales bacterium]|nr:thrombospondin type 3 repeat-containing protein [Chthoniobacterales bacterium]
PITTAPELSYTGEFFDFADVIVINPGGANQETAVIISMSPLMLKTPLLYNHSAGEMVAVVDTLTDFDNDGLTNDEEEALGTDAKNPDTDGDGFFDGAEVRLGTDPLDPNSAFRSRALEISADETQLTFTWEPSVEGNLYVIEMSETLQPNSWVKIATRRAVGGATESITISNPAMHLPRAFFRIRLGTSADEP